ncbi:MAG: hypothetical protein K5910_01365, partial [Bacteroidales bacterium]|nr:hypothetical protein [Bacteroidales bacterium]
RRAKAERTAAESLFDEEFDLDDEEDSKKSSRKKASRGFDLRGRSAKKRIEEEEDEEEEEFDDTDDEFDDDDGDEFDDDFDEEEDEDDFEPRAKKKGKGGSSSILFWILIVLLIALIAVFGIYILKRNFGGSLSNMFSHVGSAVSSNEPAEAPANIPVTADGTVSVAQDNMFTATLSDYRDENGESYYDINIYAPTGSIVHIITDAELKTKTVTVPSADHVILRVVKDVFMPNKPCDSETVTVTPNIQVETPEGETIALKVDPITVSVPALNLNLSEPLVDNVQQTYTNDPIVISGTVDDHSVEVTINGQKVTVYEGGLFTTTYTPTILPKTGGAAVPAAAPAADAPAADAPADGTVPAEGEAAPADAAPAAAPVSGDYKDAAGNELIVIEAKKNNYMTARKVITIQPYVMSSMNITVSNDSATLSSKSGSMTLTGTVGKAPDTKMTATSPSDKVKFGEPSIAADGSFSIMVMMDSVGVFPVTLTASGTGYYEGSTSITIERPPEVKYSVFLKECKTITKDYSKITSGEIVTGSYFATGKITEIIETEPYTVFRLATDAGDVICVNRSEKATIDSRRIGKKKQIIGSVNGTYADTGLPCLWGWFSLNKD